MDVDISDLVSEPLGDFIKAKVGAGEYADDREMIEDLLTREIEREDNIATMQMVVDKARASGISTRSMDDIRADALSRNHGD